MALRNIVKDGDDILRKNARTVAEIDQRVKTLVEDMADTMREGHGVGIAAPQVGVLKRIFVAIPFPEEDETPRVFINPELLSQEGTQTGDEGCLSVPGYVGTVERPMKIKLKATDLEGNTNVFEFEEYAAVIICHEYDHLDGILYTDKATNIRAASYDEEEDTAV